MSRDASKSSWGPAAGRRCPAGVTAGLMRCGGLGKWGLGGWAISHARPQRRVPCARENKVFCLRAPRSETHLLDRHSQTRAGSVSLGGVAGGVSRGRDPVPQGPHERAFGPCQLSRVSPGFSFAATAPAAAPARGSAPPAPSCPLLRPPAASPSAWTPAASEEAVRLCLRLFTLPPLQCQPHPPSGVSVALGWGEGDVSVTPRSGSASGWAGPPGPPSDRGSAPVPRGLTKTPSAPQAC